MILLERKESYYTNKGQKKTREVSTILEEDEEDNKETEDAPQDE